MNDGQVPAGRPGQEHACGLLCYINQLTRCFTLYCECQEKSPQHVQPPVVRRGNTSLHLEEIALAKSETMQQTDTCHCHLRTCVREADSLSPHLPSVNLLVLLAAVSVAILGVTHHLLAEPRSFDAQLVVSRHAHLCLHYHTWMFFWSFPDPLL